MSTFEEINYKQIIIDVKRTNPGEAFASKIVKDMLTRTLFVWAFKHPTCGYVQGINDLAATFMYIFLAEEVDFNLRQSLDEDEETDLDYNAYEITLDQVALLKDEQIQNIEADTFNCLENFLATLQENYTDKQPGVHKIMKKVEQVVKKKDIDLFNILTEIDYTPDKFVYRWVNNVLSREFSLQQLIMIWDTILAEEQDVSTYLSYVCAALLLMLADDIKALTETPDEIIMFIQDLPTSKWQNKDIKMLMAESYQLQRLYQFNLHLSTTPE